MKNKSFIVEEYVYLIKDKYTFKEELILDSNYKRLIHCFVVVNGDVIHCLLEGFLKPTLEEKDKAIKDYLKNKRRLISFEYANAKPIVELTNYKVGE